jgi:multidrug efflux pump subunit AcrB
VCERVQELAKIVIADKDVQNVSYWVGGRNSGTLNTGRMRIELKPFRERTSTASEIIGRLRRAVQPVPGVALFGQVRQDLQIGARVSKTQYQYTLQDPDIPELFQWAPIVLGKLSQLRELQDATGDLQATAPRTMLKIDRNTIGRFGISPLAIDDVLYDAFGERQVATVFTQLTQSRVILERDPSKTHVRTPCSVFWRGAEMRQPVRQPRSAAELSDTEKASKRHPSNARACDALRELFDQ